MIPPHVLQQISEDKSTTDTLVNVTLLYADIVGFTSWSSNKRPAEIVGMLSQLFTRFDKECLMNNVYKVHTIGDCYVVMSYRHEPNRNYAYECLDVI
mmetsp:Transcript_34670/g.6244  ORF Transcript_34670/g.6244 Transcript_34670/m.6244 type:complete len:97 (+) Transcript_34670:46-336(+)